MIANELYKQIDQIDLGTDDMEYYKELLDNYRKKHPSVVADFSLDDIPFIEVLDTDSELYNKLEEYYKKTGTSMEESISDYAIVNFKGKKFLCFSRGYGYSWEDRDLLGGNGDGTRKKEFEKFVETGELDADE